MLNNLVLEFYRWWQNKMKKEIGTISICLSSTKDFQDEKIVSNILEVINKSPFIPDIYGFNEPLKFKYDIKDITGPTRVWMHEEVNKKLSKYNRAAGSLMLESKNEQRGFFHFSWDKINGSPRFNFTNFIVGVDYLRENDNYKEFIELYKKLVSIAEPVYGFITNNSLPNSRAPYNLKIRLPEIRWMNFYGKPYVEMFGKEKLLSTPCYKAEVIIEDIIAIQATEDLFVDISEEVKGNIKIHLGEDAFVWGNKPIRTYKDGKVPEFDFSGVLYSKED